VKEREILVDLLDDEMGSVPVHNIFPRMSETPGSFRFAAPALGQHNEELLTAAGYLASDIDKLRKEGVIP
jgi:crotonobetainyl-CoA:carnitine CoA-transferase CaiB-like acyl-CoA transferase